MNLLSEETVSTVNGTECHTEHEPILFGAYAVYYFQTDVFFIMVVIVIAFVLLVDFLFHVLHFLTHESPFNKMISAVEKELMTVGFTAFIFKIIINSTKFLHADWLHAFELADLIVPVFSFCNCALGLILVFLSIRQCNKWSKASNLDLSELLDRFYDVKRHWLTRNNLLPHMFNTDIGKMEFRIFHDIFCEVYNLKRDAFAFDEYVNIVFERFIFTIVKIRPINWVCLCLLLFLDYARTSNELYVTNCSKEDVHCIENSSIMSFAVVGSIIFGITLVFCGVAHYYESRIIIEKGIYGYDYYPTYLQFMEDEHTIQGVRLNEEELKEAAVAMRRSYQAHQHSKRSTIIKQKKDKSAKIALEHQLEKRSSKADFIQQLDRDTVVEFMTERLKSKNSFVKGDINDGEAPIDREKIDAYCPPELLDLDSNKEPSSFTINLHELSDESSEEELDKMKPSGLKKSLGGSTKSKSSSQASLHMQAVKTLSCEIDDDDDFEMSWKRQQTGSSEASRVESDIEMIRNSMTRLPEDERNMSKKLGVHSTSTTLSAENNLLLGLFQSRQKKHVKDIYLFSSPTFFFESVKLLIMLISLNLAFWLIYFIGSVSTSAWKFLSIAPPILAFIVYIDVVKTASLLKAITTLDSDAMVEVIELSEEAQRLESEVRKEIVETLFERKELAKLSLEEKLKKVYAEIDLDGNGHMTRMEFIHFLHTLEIYPSRKAVRQIFRKMDRNVDNDISVQEFTLFIIPDNYKANEEEAKRLEEIRIRVTAKTIELAESMQHRQQNPTVWDKILGRHRHKHPLISVTSVGSISNHGSSSKHGDSSKHSEGHSSMRHGTCSTKGEYESVANGETKTHDSCDPTSVVTAGAVSDLIHHDQDDHIV